MLINTSRSTMKSFSTPHRMQGVPTIISNPRFYGVPTIVSNPRFYGLGVAPAVATGVIGGTVALAALAALVANSMEDDWSDSSVFEANMRKIHSAMLTLQCIVGGAQAGADIVDTFGNKICEGGTKAACSLSTGQLSTWRTLRDGFGAFWSDVQSFNAVMGPSDSDAKQAKQFARDFFDFYGSIQKTCQKQGAALTPLPKPPTEDEKTPVWMKYAAWGVGGVAVIALAVAAKSIFGKG
jgi:hypothetical protein